MSRRRSCRSNVRTPITLKVTAGRPPAQGDGSERTGRSQAETAQFAGRFNSHYDDPGREPRRVGTGTAIHPE
jgi:hypothetical protein